MCNYKAAEATSYLQSTLKEGTPQYPHRLHFHWINKVAQLPLICPPLPPPFACLAANVSAATSVWHRGERCPAWNAWVLAAADSSPGSRSSLPVCSAKSSSALPSLSSAGSAYAPPPALMERQTPCQWDGVLGRSPGLVLCWVRQTEISNFHQ